MNLFPDMPGITVTVTPWLVAGSQAVEVTQTLVSARPGESVVRWAKTVIPDEVLEDSAVPVAAMLEDQMGRAFRPWLYPDPNPFAPAVDQLLADEVGAERVDLSGVPAAVSREATERMEASWRTAVAELPDGTITLPRLR